MELLLPDLGESVFQKLDPFNSTECVLAPIKSNPLVLNNKSHYTPEKGERHTHTDYKGQI